MSKCSKCGREIGFIKRKGMTPLVVNPNSYYFVPDSTGDTFFIYDGEMRRGRRSSDGLKGYVLHNC